MARPAVRRDNNGAELSKRGRSLFDAASGWRSLNQELAENYFPMSADFTSSLPLGEDFALDLMDSYPVQARQQLGDAVEAMLRQGSWFQVSSGDPELDKVPAVARALQRMSQIVSAIIRSPRTHAKIAMKQADHNWVTFGANCLTWEESVDRSRPILKSHHLRDVAWAENSDTEIDVVHRRLRLSARQVMERVNAGRWQRPHPDVVRASETDPEHIFDFQHCLMPAEDYEYSLRRPSSAKFVSVYFDCEHEQVMRESPQPWFNYRINRWWRLGDCQWGFSPVAINTLPDGRMAQALGGMVLEQGEKALDPPMIGAGDVFRNDINLWSGGFTMVDLSDGRNLQDVMTVVDTAKNIAVGENMQAQLRSMIAEGFLLNKLMLPNTKEMTAFEVGWRTDEFRRAALPFFSPIEDEYHAPVLDGALQMAFQMGMLTRDDVPRELAGRDNQWTFISPLNEAEGQKVAAAFRQTVADVASILQIDPTARNNVNWTEALQDALRGNGAKPGWLPTEDEKKALADAQKQLADASTQADALQRGAQVAADVSNATMTAQQAGLLNGAGMQG